MIDLSVVGWVIGGLAVVGIGLLLLQILVQPPRG